jgi:septum formation protein
MKSPFIHTRPLILASSSPRRQAFLRELGLEFRLAAPIAPEPGLLPGEHQNNFALRTASAKALEVMSLMTEQYAGSAAASPLVLAADTIVVLPEETPAGNHCSILGKPASEHEAITMLMRLSGRTHIVITACCLLPGDGEPCCFTDSAYVTFAPWPEEIIRAYAATGEPLDKAGAYGIQGKGSFLVEKISGSWSTVVGLPVSHTLRALLDIGALKLP